MKNGTMNSIQRIVPLLMLSLLGFSAKAYSHEGSMTQADTDLARKIHLDLAADSNLSAYAQNIKVIALDGKVILKGKVSSAGERKSIISKVTGESGVSDVVNKLEVNNVDAD